MTFEKFKSIRGFGKYTAIDIEEFATAHIMRILKIDKTGKRKQNSYNYRYSIKFLYNGKERTDNSKEFKNLKALRKSFEPLFTSRNLQTEKQGKVRSNW